MADLILHKRSSTASAVPSAGSIALGELAINTADGRLFLKKGDGTVVDVTSIGGIQGLTAALAGKEPAITAGTSTDFWRGDKTWQNFGNATRAQVLTGLGTPTNTAIAAADTILAAFAKLQGQVTARMTNPMTAAGDMIRGGTSGAPERVAAGTNGYVWTMVAGVPVWAAAGSEASYQSSAAAFVGGGLLTLTHGLGVKPTRISAALVCKTANIGYSVGDEIPYPTFATDSGGSTGLSVVATTTQIFVRMGASNFVILDKASGVTTFFTAANWDIIIRARP